MKLKSFDDLFNILISDCALIEEEKLKILPKLIEKCQSKELKTALEKHLNEAKQHYQNVKQLAKESGIKMEKMEWENPMKSVFENMVKFLEENNTSALLDAAIITLLQQIEHLEIAHFGTLREYATITEKEELRELLRTALKEEKQTDSLLIRLARESGINMEAKKAQV